MGYPYFVKTTIEIAEPLMRRAKKLAKQRGITLRALIEEGLHRVLEAPAKPKYVFKDCRVGKPGDPWPLAGMSWEQIRDEILYPVDHETWRKTLRVAERDE